MAKRNRYNPGYTAMERQKNKKFKAGLTPKEFKSGMADLMGKGKSKTQAYLRMTQIGSDPQKVHNFRKERVRQRGGMTKAGFRRGMAKLMNGPQKLSKTEAYEKMKQLANSKR